MIKTDQELEATLERIRHFQAVRAVASEHHAVSAFVLADGDDSDVLTREQRGIDERAEGDLAERNPAPLPIVARL